ncbi:caspase family protein [Bradyrhizobium sp.]|uniref:caspase family protein n=1 Tax=Bradyrhizobium sp. TaxID=376 RepID=UPI003C796F97
MSARLTSRRAVLLLALFAAEPFPAFESAAAQDKLKIEVVPQVGHLGLAYSVAFSPDGRTVLSGSADKTAKLWDVATGKLLRTFQGHSQAVKSVLFSPDGHTVLSGSADKTLKLWDVSTGRLLRTFEGHSDEVRSVVFSPDGRAVLSGSDDKTLKLWDVPTGRLLRTFQGHSGEVESVAFSRDGRTALSGSDDKTLGLWDVATGKLLRTFKGHSKAVKSVLFSPDGHTALSGSADQTLRLWDVATGKPVGSFEGDSGALALSSDGRTVLSGGIDHRLKLWEVVTGKLLRTFEEEEKFLSRHNTVAFSPDGRTVLSDDGKRLKLWDAATGKLVRTLGGQLAWVRSVAFSPDGRTVISGSWHYHGLRLFDAATGKLAGTFGKPGEELEWIDSVAFSPDGRTVLSGGINTLKLWDVATGKLVRTFEEGDFSLEHSHHSVTFSPDGRTVLSDVFWRLKLWDAATGKLVRTFEEKGEHSSNDTVAFSPDGRTVLSGSDNKTLKLWDVATGKLLRTFKGHLDKVRSVAFSPDGRAVLSGSDDKTLKLWDVTTGKLVRSFEGHSGEVASVAFSPDGRAVLSGNADKTLKLWDAGTGELLRTFEGHSDEVRSVAFSPDGRTALSGSLDGTVRFWSLSSGNEIVQLLATQEGDWLAITPAGFFDFGGDSENLLHLVRGLDVLSIGQTFGQLYRSDLVQAALKGDLEGKYKDAAYRLNLETILGSGPAPQIEHLKEKDDRAGDTIRISVRITGTGGGVGSRIDWKVNRVGQGNPTPAALASVDGPIASVIVTETLKLVPGKVNVVNVTAYNHAGLVATPPFKISIDKFGTTATERPRMFVLALGVNRYRIEGYQLNYAANDAESFAKALKIVGSTLFAEVKTTTLTDEQVSEAGISSAINDIAREAKTGDVFVLFLGGHGRSIAGRYYYYPQTLDFAAHQSVEKNAIDQDKWDGWLRQIPALKSLLVIDTCEGDAFRGSRGTESARETAMTQLEHATGRNIISAARDAAYEGYQGHGVLTYALLEALDIKAAHSGDEQVRVDALAAYVQQRVPEITKSIQGVEQLPTRKLSGNDFPIGNRQPVLEVRPAIPKEPTHVVIRAELVREKPSSDSPGSRQLEPGMRVRAVEFSGAWALIARDGQKLGYTPADALARMQ